MICSKCGKKNKDGALYCKRCNQILGGVSATGSSVSGGLFGENPSCAICGGDVGFGRVKLGKTTDGRDIWKCMACSQKGGFVEIDFVTGKATLKTEQETEIRNKCNSCGHMFSYTAGDIERNKQRAKQATLSSLTGVAAALSGNYVTSSVSTGNASDQLDKIVDYSRCPKCNSMDIRKLSKSEWEAEQNRVANNSNAVFSAADEIKKFKELLDLGIITQEEFEQKKKQLLGL